MRPELEKIQQALEAALLRFAESRGTVLADQIRPILLANLDRGRLQTFINGRIDQIALYIEQVAEKFASLNPFLHALQVEKDTDAWSPLFERMKAWAYTFFIRKGFPANEATRDIAIECATEAALALISAHFPYDTEFDPWAHIIVINTCRKFIEKAFRKSVVPQKNIVDLDDNLTNAEELLLEIKTLQTESESDISNALAQLSESRRTVIQWIYFEDISPEEVAQKMDKSVGAIYSLQFNALHDLRKILSTIRDNINE